MILQSGAARRQGRPQRISAQWYTIPMARQNNRVEPLRSRTSMRRNCMISCNLLSSLRSANSVGILLAIAQIRQNFPRQNLRAPSEKRVCKSRFTPGGLLPQPSPHSIQDAVTRRRVGCPPVLGRFHQLAYAGASASVTRRSRSEAQLQIEGCESPSVDCT
jgi:hypothetical protein